MCVLFADTSDGNVAIMTVIAGFIGGAAVWLKGYFDNRHERKRKEYKEDEKSIVDHLKEVEERCAQENKELKNDLKFTNKRLQQVFAHLMYLEGILESKGVSFRRLEPEAPIGDDAVDLNQSHKQGSDIVKQSSPRIRQTNTKNSSEDVGQ